jgi:hypothetical protein
MLYRNSYFSAADIKNRITEYKNIYVAMHRVIRYKIRKEIKIGFYKPNPCMDARTHNKDYTNINKILESIYLDDKIRI